MSNTRAARQRERQREVAAAVTEAGSIRIEELAERFGISLMTIHRDLDDLQERGLLHKSRGVATALSTSLLEASDTYRLGLERPAKEELAHAALAFIEPNQALLLDDSTTTLAVAELLGECVPLTVATNYLPIVTELAGTRGISLLALGGQFFDWANAFLGGMTIQAVERLHVDLLIMSTSVVIDGHCFHQTQETVATKRAMLRSAERSILLLDHTKLSRQALHRLCPVSEFEHVIVDSRTDDDDVRRLEEAGARVTVATPLADGSDHLLPDKT